SRECCRARGPGTIANSRDASRGHDPIDPRPTRCKQFRKAFGPRSRPDRSGRVLARDREEPSCVPEPFEDRFTMSAPQCDAMVFFGATGDLAYKKIFPALYAMVRHGRLDVPVIGVAKAGWDIDRFRQRARESIAAHGGVDEAAFDTLSRLLRYVDGDYRDPATFQSLRKILGDAEH